MKVIIKNSSSLMVGFRIENSDSPLENRILKRIVFFQNRNQKSNL